jgi:hypothetical protein
MVWEPARLEELNMRQASWSRNDVMGKSSIIKIFAESFVGSAAESQLTSQ